MNGLAENIAGVDTVQLKCVSITNKNIPCTRFLVTACEVKKMEMISQYQRIAGLCLLCASRYFILFA
jgi:hypothetical protein